MKTLSILLSVVIVLLGQSKAALFVFEGQVTDVSFDSLAGGPSLGESVTFSIFIDDSDPNLGIFDSDIADPFTSLLPMISITTAGGLSASIGSIIVSGSPTTSNSSYSLSTLGPGISPLPFPNFSQNLHSAGFSFDPFAFVDPANPTVGELVAALTMSSAVSGGFTAGTQDSDTFEFGSFRATFDTSEIPLPGAVLFFLTGGLALLRGRRLRER